ncbi:MAG: AMP-binding protein [Marmoricola sp.]
MSTVRDLLLRQADSDRVAVRWREDGLIRELTWRDYVAASARLASLLEARLDPALPPHVGVLLPNAIGMALHLAAAGLGGHVLVGLNDTRRGEALEADIRKADCQFVIDSDEFALEALAAPEVEEREARHETTPDSLFMLIFTSGTSGNPKAVRITHDKVVYPGKYLTERLGLTADDVFYVSMPMFHSNAVMAGWAPALTLGAPFAVASFSASRFLPDVRDFGATFANYVGKPLAYVLATPTHPDDADNPLRLVFGNEAGARDIAAFGERFGCYVVDGFGSTENAVVVTRVPGTPAGSLGRGLEGVAILDPSTGEPCPPAEFDAAGRVTNLDECTGELVNTLGTGQFAGYYNDPDATAERMRGGRYWSGDLAYADADGWIYYAGRTSDWLRVDGENLAAAPIEAILLRHPAISQAAVYALPDPLAGDQLAVALVLTDDITPADFGVFLAAQSDLGTKAWPSVVRILDELPRTATNKVLKRELRAEGVPSAGAWMRAPRTQVYVTQD